MIITLNSLTGRLHISLFHVFILLKFILFFIRKIFFCHLILPNLLFLLLCIWCVGYISWSRRSGLVQETSFGAQECESPWSTGVHVVGALCLGLWIFLLQWAAAVGSLVGMAGPQSSELPGPAPFGGCWLLASGTVSSSALPNDCRAESTLNTMATFLPCVVHQRDSESAKLFCLPVRKS